MNYKINISPVINELISIADSLEGLNCIPLMGPHPLMVYITNLESTKLTIKCMWRPDHIRTRVNKLRIYMNRINKNHGYLI